MYPSSPSASWTHRAAHMTTPPSGGHRRLNSPKSNDSTPRLLTTSDVKPPSPLSVQGNEEVDMYGEHSKGRMNGESTAAAAARKLQIMSGAGMFGSSPSKTQQSAMGTSSNLTASGKRRASMGKWTEEEDALLRQAVNEFGGRSWKKIALRLNGRTDVQCLHRWQKVLKPGLIKVGFLCCRRNPFYFVQLNMLI